MFWVNSVCFRGSACACVRVFRGGGVLVGVRQRLYRFANVVRFDLRAKENQIDTWCHACANEQDRRKEGTQSGFDKLWACVVCVIHSLVLHDWMSASV